MLKDIKTIYQYLVNITLKNCFLKNAIQVNEKVLPFIMLNFNIDHTYHPAYNLCKYYTDKR